MIRKEYRDDSPDSIGYIEEDHPLRPTAAQSVRLLQVPPSEDDHNTYSFTTSFTDMDVPIFTRETAFERDRQHSLTPRLLFVTFAAVIGSAFQHGYNTGVVNAPQDLITDWIRTLMRYEMQADQQKIDDRIEGWITLVWAIIVSVFCFGGMLGGLLAGFVSETLGRKWAIILNNVLVFLSALLMGMSKHYSSYYMLIFGRFLIGINCGLNAGIIPMYLSEIAPINLRGMIGSSYQLIITVSILLSQVLGMKSLLGTERGWPILLTLIVVPAIFQLLTMPFCVESPKYLWSRGKEQSAAKALEWLRGTHDVQGELDLIKSETDAQKSAGSLTLSQMLSNASLRTPLIIAVVVMLAQQLSGINAVIFYSKKIFQDANLSNTASEMGTIAMGAMNVLMTFVSSILVEAAGRKTLLLAGFGGMAIDTILLTITLFISTTTGNEFFSYMSIVWVVGFVVIFAIGPGSIPWFLVSELFMQNARPMATSIAVGVNWGANFLVGLGFPILRTWLGTYVFVIFIVLQIMFTMFIYKKVPETKNKTPEEIAAVFRQMSYQ